jgi:hypothetical protein
LIATREIGARFTGPSASDTVIDYIIFVAPAGTANPEVIDLGEGRDPAWSPVK